MLAIIGKLLSNPNRERPVFVVGGSRSGTSVLVQALGKHKMIYSFKGEAPFITDIGGMVHNLEYAPERELAYYKNSLRVSHGYIYENLRRLSYESAFGYNYGLAQILKDLTRGDYNPLTKRVWCAKTFPNKNVAKGLIKLFPKLKFILIHRNGINVVHSRMQFHGFRDLDFRRQCEEWARSCKQFSYLLNHERAITVKHSDLIEDPHIIFGKICEHLDIDYDQGPAEFTSTHQVHPLSSVATATDINVKEVISQRRPAEESWTLEQRQTFKEVCADAMETFGYVMPF